MELSIPYRLSPMKNLSHLERFQQFRQDLYLCFDKRRDSILNLIDALCSHHQARSVPELSLHPNFPRTHHSIYKAIDKAFPPHQPTATCDLTSHRCLQIVASTFPSPPPSEAWTFGVDTTSYLRPHAPTLLDREFVHSPNPTPGQTPVGLGHSYSLLCCLPPPTPGLTDSWAVPLQVERVASLTDPITLAHQQVAAVLGATQAPWFGQLTVLASDSRYGSRHFLFPLFDFAPLVTVTRVRSNRTFFQSPPPPEPGKRGRPRWYGPAMKLAEPETWPPPATIEWESRLTAKGQRQRVRCQRWSHLLMRGSRQQPMHDKPFDLVQVQVYDEATEQPLYAPMWLIVFGQRRQHLSALQTCRYYRRRFNQEHGLRTLKRQLLLTRCQTPDVDREANWVRLCCLAYAQLWAARHLAQDCPLPWQRHLPERKAGRLGPSQVQRDFARIIAQLESLTRPVKPRGKGKGRSTGTKLEPRRRRLMVKRRPPQCRCAQKKPVAAA